LRNIQNRWRAFRKAAARVEAERDNSFGFLVVSELFRASRFAAEWVQIPRLRGQACRKRTQEKDAATSLEGDRF
jgi:hypothetical protein